MPTYGPPFVYSMILAQASGIGTGTHNFGSVPAGKLHIVRDISWFQPAPGVGTYATALLVEATLQCAISGFNLSPGTNSNLVTDSGRFCIFTAGQVYQVTSNSVAGLTIILSGQELTAP